MKTDKIAKTLLGIIAVCLLKIAFINGSMVSQAHAAASVTTASVAVPINPDGSINVKVVSEDQYQRVIISGWTVGDDNMKGNDRSLGPYRGIPVNVNK